jgi:hypothetical protein
MDSTLSVTAVVACCATSFATRVTRASGEPRRDAFFTTAFFATAFFAFPFFVLPVFTRVFTRGRFAATAGRDTFFADDFFALATRRRAGVTFLIAGRLADDFFAAFFALLRVVGPLRLLPLLAADFPRDFLARVAMILLLGVGGEIQVRG